MLPTPPAAADTATVSPGPAPTARTAAKAVQPATYREPAASQLSSVGLAISWSARTATWLAWLDRSHEYPSTSSPGAHAVTPSPTSVTTPARSLPWPEGNAAGKRSSSRPWRMAASPGLIPAALTATTTWPAEGTGMGISAT